MRNKRDLAKQRHQRNPYKLEIKSWKNQLYITLGTLCVLTMTGMGLYHPFFHVSDITVSGTERLNATEVANMVDGIIDYKTLFVFPKKSYFLVNVDEIKDILLERLAIDGIRVEKEFPDTIHVEVTEKLSTVIYDDGHQYGYLDVSGYLVEVVRTVGDDEWDIKKEIVTSTIMTEDGEEKEVEEERIIEKKHIIKTQAIVAEMGDYPIIYDTRNEEHKEHTEILQTEIVFGAITWFTQIKERTDIPFRYIEIDGEIGEGRIYTREGWHIDIYLTKDITRQFDTLQYLLEEKIDRSSVGYIDLRFGDRVYWK
ncbi:MAG: FtsQ-type POTRA domain-containing protein [Candidatus Magasanikbacteria bacterium]|nr:FtsQ-type POTRA domain-containing protein [Candidatus Magasanikbacteria bacterium]MBT4071801.1 FtsQ-type POTRA domain-containing protein [Candidatus Magasanikbacteria bacterium]